MELEKVSKRFDREWIIRDFDQTFEAGKCYGISGRNGSGKSTLLRLISGQLSPSRGRVHFQAAEKSLDAADVYPQLSMVGPYMDTIEELTLEEALRFHFQFKPLIPGLVLSELPQVLNLVSAQQRYINTYSSGMKQRVKLGLALFSNTPLVLLDEPTITLDQEGQNWFQTQLQKFKAKRLIIIASNVSEDLAQCEALITSWK